MSYEKGELVVLTQAERDRFRELEDRHDLDDDEQEQYELLFEKYGNGSLYRDAPIAYLQHRCDEWEIGGPAEVRALIQDLNAALYLMEGRKRKN